MLEETPQLIAAASEPESFAGPWRAFFGFIGHPVAAVILAISWLLTNRLKYFVAQWLPVHVVNLAIYLWNAHGVSSRLGELFELDTVPRWDRICTGPRYFLTWVLAGVITYYTTQFLGGVLEQVLPKDYGWDLHTIGIMLAIASPMVVLGFFAAAKHSPWPGLREFADKLGASELSLSQQERELVAVVREAEEAGEDPADALSKTRIGHVFGRKDKPEAEK